jgi:Na+-transporting methylmalonyl-CoA/oxaloacetate decarboxylase gamma subunit
MKTRNPIKQPTPIRKGLSEADQVLYETIAFVIIFIFILIIFFIAVSK